MESETLFSIGELADLCGITPKALRYYDKLDLLKPAMINPQNGYRFYTKWHVTRISTIKLLQDMGLTLDSIKEFLTTNQHDDVIDCLSGLLKVQEDCITRQIADLSEKLELIHATQAQCKVIRQHASDADSSMIIREIPQRRIVCTACKGRLTAEMRRTVYQKIQTDLKAAGHNAAKIISAGPLALGNTPNLLLGYEVNTDGRLPLPTLLLETGLYACSIYRGSYRDLNDELLQQIYDELSVLGYTAGFPLIQYYYINESLTDDADNYLTEIQIPLKITDS